MKKITYITFSLILVLCVAYLSIRLNITERCMQVWGWEYYKMLPVPMCHVEKQVSTLEYLESIQNKVVPENVNVQACW